MRRRPPCDEPRQPELVHELRARQARLEALLDVTRQLGVPQPIEQLLETIAGACGKLLDCDAVGVRRLEGDELVATGAYGDAKDLTRKPRLKIGESLAGRVAATGRPLIVNDLEASSYQIPEHREAALRLGHRAFLGVPVKIGDRLAGVLAIRTRNPRGFSDADLAIATAFAAQAAVALENARLYASEQAARAEAETLLQRYLESQEHVRQMQKMEAVGRLAGGIAHDFNNLLTVITGRSHFMLRHLGEADPMRVDLAIIQETAQRAAALTTQLLAFSRKQLLQPRVVSAEAIVRGLASMLQRLIGEDIELDIVSTADASLVNVDPGQLEQVIVNLAVNARDAMPGGGRLAIETSRIELDAATAAGLDGLLAGPHVMIAVSDSGIGMDEETRARIFEPFFTTKDAVHGTGLGLATVYGIVQQHQGALAVESAPGRGATFRIYLPTTTASLEVTTVESPAGSLAGTETVLLVEDEAELRSVVRQILEQVGYIVLEAASGHEAVEMARRNPRSIELLLADVIMPRMSGREVAAHVTQDRPDLKVLYMSGYTHDVLGPLGRPPDDLVLLQKPFTPETLARSVREVLDSRSSAR